MSVPISFGGVVSAIPIFALTSVHALDEADGFGWIAARHEDLFDLVEVDEEGPIAAHLGAVQSLVEGRRAEEPGQRGLAGGQASRRTTRKS